MNVPLSIFLMPPPMPPYELPVDEPDEPEAPPRLGMPEPLSLPSEPEEPPMPGRLPPPSGEEPEEP